MSIEISREKCVACGACAVVCPGTLIWVDAAAYIKTPDNCWGCASCVKECPRGAIRLYLGADAGGRGGKLSARRDGALTHWSVEKPDGKTVEITVDSRESNAY
ncbi:MAG: ferredoxin family protein [Oscillospiraceae bacterium]|jgi:adenylylsulfate reductase subunit B|nr:ferredoxin family protein [Oscillospiraceae bacterium]